MHLTKIIDKVKLKLSILSFEAGTWANTGDEVEPEAGCQIYEGSPANIEQRTLQLPSNRCRTDRDFKL